MLGFFMGLSAVSLALAFFLGHEMLKKFRFMQGFLEHSNQMVTWVYPGGAKSVAAPGMYNVVLRGQKPFCALVGFTLKIGGYQGFDYYGCVQSDDYGVAVVSTYLGRGSVEFRFFVNSNLDSNLVVASSTAGDQRLMPHVAYPPHWYQRLGFYS